jgi:hypothetical protein
MASALRPNDDPLMPADPGTRISRVNRNGSCAQVVSRGWWKLGGAESKPTWWSGSGGEVKIGG